MVSLTTTVQELVQLEADLQKHLQQSKERTDELTSAILTRKSHINLNEVGLDTDKIALAETVIRIRGWDSRTGEWESCREDAIRQLAMMGTDPGPVSPKLWHVFLAVKNYAQWTGQRCDCEYGYCPAHGHITFAIGLIDDVRIREPQRLTPEEIEAAIYYLINQERIQAARKAVTEPAVLQI